MWQEEERTAITPRLIRSVKPSKGGSQTQGRRVAKGEKSQMDGLEVLYRNRSG